MSDTFLLQNYVLVENCDVNIKFIHLNGPAAQFFRPNCEALAGSQYMILQKYILYHLEALVDFTALTVMRWNMYKTWCDLFGIHFQQRVLKKLCESANMCILLDYNM